ncbi:phosphoribosylglycinamide formyltransferase [Devosia psychrophila]|uniref:Phosphoribosylglycinamide formyltransferase n=1 Tax=Devosia psychrophila TaxID=728005 RepID=A0A0F5Q296_9HYPH|nr:phosphoribosylglycinamide formyltransferase [Devosia psychrophila]KKC34751.1 phosphoribosylglycinamide formyltransferase [Devosia psychrophila]SFC06813.1 phosphoribosylglycinamide formyltransferase-1 [Devosia psychrophila]
MSRIRVAILISGRGSNMSALIEAAKAPDYPAEIVGVLSNRAAAPGLEIAASHGIATASLAQSRFPSRDMFEDIMTQMLESWDVDIVCLAGFMRILGEDFVTRWAGKMINIHPSLLPLYKGLHTHERALADGAKVHGCTVHFVTPGLDEGAPILQAEVPVLPGDTPESLSARVLIEEHRIYPEALRTLASTQALAP